MKLTREILSGAQAPGFSRHRVQPWAPRCEMYWVGRYPVPNELPTQYIRDWVGRYPVPNELPTQYIRDWVGRYTQYADYLETLETEARAAGFGCHPSGVFD